MHKILNSQTSIKSQKYVILPHAKRTILILPEN